MSSKEIKILETPKSPRYARGCGKSGRAALAVCRLTQPTPERGLSQSAAAGWGLRAAS